MSETGPMYGVELIGTLPLNYGQTKGMLQAMPSRADLVATQKQGDRVSAGFEVLLNHWREQADEIERLRAENKALSECDGLPTASAQYVHALNTIVDLREIVHQWELAWIGLEANFNGVTDDESDPDRFHSWEWIDQNWSVPEMHEYKRRKAILDAARTEP